jgi:hypothetical protein
MHMEGRSLRRALAVRKSLIATFAGTVLLVSMAMVSPGSAGSEGASAVGAFFAAPVYTSHAGRLTILRLELPGISPGEGLTAACSACGTTQFTRTNGHNAAVLTPSPSLRVSSSTRLIIGAFSSGLVGRWKVYGLRRGAFARLAVGCMPASVTVLTGAGAANPATIAPANCSPISGSPPGAEYVVWQGTDGRLWELEYAYGVWGRSTSIYRGPLDSPPTVAVHPDGQQDVFWKARDGGLWKMSYNGAWDGPVKLAGAGKLGSAPSALVGTGGVDHVFWRGSDGILWELSDPAGHWGISAPFNSGRLASAPAVAVHADGEQDVFWKGTDSRLWELRRTTTGWQTAVNLAGAGRLGSAPTAAVDPEGVDHVFWSGPDGLLWELSNPGRRWGAAVLFNSGVLGSPPAVAIHPNGDEDVFWKGSTGGGLWDMWYARGWHRPVRLPGAGRLGSQPAAAAGD